MSQGINKVILIGNLGNEPEVRYAPGGDCIANFSVATSESWKDKQTGQRQERTEWHRVVAFRRLGEICGEYLSKGSKVYLEGKLQTRKWQDKTGAYRYTTEIVADQMQMLDSRSDQNTQQGGYNAERTRQQAKHAVAGDTAITQRQQSMAPPQSDSFEDDDLPF